MSSTRMVASQPSSRIGIVDSLKGVAIALVVLGHAIQYSIPDFLSNPLYRTIYAFHMPLLMTLSGFVVGRRSDGYGLVWISRRAASLLVPFFVWLGLYYFTSRLPFTGLHPFVDYSMGWLEYMKLGVVFPSNGLWYLWVLFLCCGAVALTAPLRTYIGRWFLLVAWLLVALVPTNLFGIGQLKWYLIFFVIGFVLRSRSDDAELLAPRWALPATLVGFVLVTAVELGYAPVVVPPPAPNPAVLAFYAGKFVWAVSGMALAWTVVSAISGSIVEITLRRLGLISIEVYACHMLFLNAGVGSGWVAVFSTMLLALGGALAVAMLLDAFQSTRGLFFGRWWSGNPFGHGFWSVNS